jgi:ubiquinone/menaquinone biosynthesis C-methylase UbiE
MNTMKQKLKKLRDKITYDQKYECDKKALSYMKECSSILDIGCGEGRFIEHDPKRISGVDHNMKSVSLCGDKGYDVRYGKVTELPFDSGSFDAVHCSHVIEHLLPGEAHQLLREMDRVLKEGGIFCLRTPLLHRGFYNDLTHIKPYNHRAILHYIRIEETRQRTLSDIPGIYRKVFFRYRREPLFPEIKKTPFKHLWIFFDILYRFGITNTNKTGYILILRKIK